MKIVILKFKIMEALELRQICPWWKFWTRYTPQYHYDIRMEVFSPIPLEENDFIQLPNGLKLIIWKSQQQIIWAKTYSMTEVDLRGYRTIYAHLCYEKRHGHLNDRAS